MGPTVGAGGYLGNILYAERASAMNRDDAILVLTLGSEIYVKSDRTRRRFWARLRANLVAALERDRVVGDVDTLERNRMVVRTSEPFAAADTIRQVFGIHRVDLGVPLAWRDLDDLATATAAVAGDHVDGSTFAVRVRRSGGHEWGSPDAARAIGTALLERSAGVDLDDPEVEVNVLVIDERAWYLERSWDGPGGLPLGTQDRCLALLSGGFDSPVAAWRIMGRGCPVDFLHVRLECAQSDHAIAVAYELWRRWGAGTTPLAWTIDFTDVKTAIEERVPPRLRQVILKQLMFAASDRLAERLDLPAVITGEAIGQVSSQTLHHMAEIDRMCARTVLRPLVGEEKNDIVERAHAIGTGELSARAHEVCDLAGSRVAIAAQRTTLERAMAELPEDLAARAADEPRVVSLADWMPGTDAVPVLLAVHDDVTLVDTDDAQAAAHDEPIVIGGGPDAVRVATRLRAGGRDVSLAAEAVPGWTGA